MSSKSLQIVLLGVVFTGCLLVQNVRAAVNTTTNSTVPAGNHNTTIIVSGNSTDNNSNQNNTNIIDNNNNNNNTNIDNNNTTTTTNNNTNTKNNNEATTTKAPAPNVMSNASVSFDADYNSTRDLFTTEAEFHDTFCTAVRNKMGLTTQQFLNCYCKSGSIIVVFDINATESETYDSLNTLQEEVNSDTFTVEVDGDNGPMGITANQQTIKRNGEDYVPPTTQPPATQPPGTQQPGTQQPGTQQPVTQETTDSNNINTGGNGESTPAETTPMSGSTNPQVTNDNNNNNNNNNEIVQSKGTITFDGDFDATCNRYNSFEDCRQAICQLVMQKMDLTNVNFKNCNITSGSIIVNFDVEATASATTTAFDNLHEHVKANTIKISDNGNDVPVKQNSVLKDNAIYVHSTDNSGGSSGSSGSTTEDEESDKTWIAILVVFLLIAIIVLIFLFVYVFVIKKKQKVSPSQQELTNRKTENTA